MVFQFDLYILLEHKILVFNFSCYFLCLLSNSLIIFIKQYGIKEFPMQNNMWGKYYLSTSY